jgi:hypothetical protein
VLVIGAKTHCQLPIANYPSCKKLRRKNGGGLFVLGGPSGARPSNLLLLPKFP